jgi:phosphatidate cytidylyltransferase
MLQRVITGVVALAILIVILVFRQWMGGALLYGAIILLYIVSLHEMIVALRTKGLKPSSWVLFLTGILILPAYLWRGAQGTLIVYCVGTVLALCSAIFIRDPREGDLVATAFPLVYPTLPFLTLFMIVALPEPYSLPMFCSVLMSSMLSDLFALVAGSLFGKRKLMPSVSPNKTWAGAVGGFVMSIVGMAIFGVVVNLFVEHDIWFFHFIIMGAIGSIATQLGDLVASAVKRYCGVKDFGKFFPGHGGVLDRLDGMLINSVFLYIYGILVIGGIH